MKKALRVFIILLAVVVVAIAGIGAYVKLGLPNVGPPENITIERTPKRIERGRYLANNVLACMDCHSQRDWTRFAGPPKTEGVGGGGEIFGKELGLPGTIHTSNITPYSLGGWTDGEIFRAITTGVNRQGKALFPIMPYPAYGKLDREDIYSVISYLRTLPAVKNDVPATELDFPINLIVHTMPAKATLENKPDTTDELAYGKYLITGASCVDCHSKNEKGALVAGTEFGGGREFKFPNGMVRSPNITPDEKTGIGGKYTREQFIRRFKLYADSNYQAPQVKPTDFNTPMPWTMFAQMSEKDLGAIYAYLKTVKPINNTVVRFQPN